MTWQAWATVAVIGVSFGLLAVTRLAAELVLVAAVAVLMTAGIITPAEALSGLSNEGLVAVGLLFVVSAGLRETGAMNLVFDRWLRRPRSVRSAQLRVMGPVAALSTVLNNTPLVAVMLPVVSDWAKRHGIAPSKLLIPLSYATVLGGMCTLIGTSTNVIASGMLMAADLPGLGLFEIGRIGLPCTIVGVAYLALVGDRLLPDRRPVLQQFADSREYSVEMVVEAGSALVGRTIEEAGLRNLPNVYLMEIERDGRLLVAVSPRERLCADDRLVFVGVVDSVVDLKRIRGLKSATDQIFKVDAPRHERCLVEAVVSTACPLVGQSIREGRFRTVYNAAVIAVARDGERLNQKIGDIVLQPGDTLLLEAHPSFADQQRNSRDFFLVSRVQDSEPPRHERAWVALAILIAMMVSVAADWLPLITATLLAAGATIATRCASVIAVRRSIDWQVLLVIAAAIGLGKAMESTGVAATVSATVLGFADNDPYLALAMLYFATMLLTEVLSNAATVVLMFPVAQAIAAALSASLVPFVIVIMMAASAGFITPFGYQTNLMVLGPGNYRFGDYAKIGTPLGLMCAAITIALVPLFWPLGG
jgi:di/tricarboxylate transporter